MAVYKRTYKRYEGPLTSETSRFTILARYGLKNVFEARINTILFTAAFLPHLVAAGLIYVLNNLDALETVGLPPIRELGISVDEKFFLALFAVETFVSFFIVSLMGPGLVSPDLANGSLPLYFSRPFSRTEYVAGKLSVLLVLASLITWVPGLLLIGIQTSLAGFSWLSEHGRILSGVLIGSWIWILTISLIALALSAWVRWKPVAAAALFGVFFVAAGFGTAANGLLDMKWGTLLNMAVTMRMLWRWLLLGESVYVLGPGPGSGGELQAWYGLLSMTFICVLSLVMLGKKVRATQVVR